MLSQPASNSVSETELDTPGSGHLTAPACVPESAGPLGQLECWPPAGCLGLSQRHLGVWAPLPTARRDQAQMDGNHPASCWGAPLCHRGCGCQERPVCPPPEGAGVHPGPLGPQGQRTPRRPVKSTGEFWGLCGSKVWDGFPSSAYWLLRGDKVATPPPDSCLPRQTPPPIAVKGPESGPVGDPRPPSLLL